MANRLKMAEHNAILGLARLGLFKELGRSFKTTNCIENLNALIGQRTDKVDCWRNADQKHRWLATTLLDIEPRLRKVSGYHALPHLRAALEAHAKGTLEKVAQRVEPFPISTTNGIDPRARNGSCHRLYRPSRRKAPEFADGHTSALVSFDHAALPQGIGVRPV